MRQTNLTIVFEEAKLTALKRYLAKKEIGLEDEMISALNKLYEKYVPAQVREYIEEIEVPLTDISRPKRTVRATSAPQDESGKEEKQNEQL